jgi:hypothetical protein
MGQMAQSDPQKLNVFGFGPSGTKEKLTESIGHEKMSKIKHKTVSKGTFYSPALNSDGPYELVNVMEGRTVTGQAVKCVRSQQLFDISVLSRPTAPQINDQVTAFYREIGAWLVANAPSNPARQRAALRMLRRAVSEDYVISDLERDVAWIATADLGERIAFLRDNVDERGRERIVEFGAEVGAVSGGVSETDAEFIERVGVGLGLPAAAVYDIVVAKLHQPPAVA